MSMLFGGPGFTALLPCTRAVLVGSRRSRAFATRSCLSLKLLGPDDLGPLPSYYNTLGAIMIINTWNGSNEYL